MSQTIKTYADLCEERERIKNLMVLQKQKIKDDWKDLREEFLPVKTALGVVGKMASADKSNPLLNAGLKVASDLFLRNFILAKAGWVTKFAVPFVVKNYSSHLLAEGGGNFLDKLANLFKGKRRKSNAHAKKQNGDINSDLSEKTTPPAFK
jgi:hypothetical protein